MSRLLACQRQIQLARLSLLLATLSIAASSCRSTTPTPQYDIAPQVAAAKTLMTRSDIARAFEFVERERDVIVREWQTVTEIPAPSGDEKNRAEYVRERIRELGLPVESDTAGNLIATRKGTGGGKRVVFDAHLDTVFPTRTNLKTRIADGRIFAPGVGDDTRNVIALLAMMRAMNAANVETKGDIVFLFSVEEETNFKGIDQFVADRGKTVDRFVALDGGYENFTYGGIGIYWDRYHFIGPGGHTRSNASLLSATVPLARAIDRIYKLKVPANAWLNVGMLGGADVFNAKAADAWMSVDLRSNDPATLHRLNRDVESIVRKEAERAGMTMKREEVSKSEPASLPGHRTSPMVQTTEAVFRAFGFEPEITDTASNHASPVILAGIPAIGTGSAPCRAAHSEEENCEIDPILIGIKRNVVLAVALSE